MAVRYGVVFGTRGTVRWYDTLAELEAEAPDDFAPAIAEVQAAESAAATGAYASAGGAYASSSGYARFHGQFNCSGTSFRLDAAMGRVNLKAHRDSQGRNWNNRICSAYVVGRTYLWDLEDGGGTRRELLGLGGTYFDDLAAFNYRASSAEHQQ